MQIFCFNKVSPGNLLIIWLILHTPLCVYGQSLSQIVRRTATKQFSYVSRTQYSTLPSTIIPSSSSSSSQSSISLFTTTLTMATSSTSLPTPTPSPSPTLLISVHVPPYVYSGEEVVFNCSVEPNQNVTFIWRFQDEIVAMTAQYTTKLQENSNDCFWCEVNNTFYGVSNQSCLPSPTVHLISSISVGYTRQSLFNLNSDLHCFVIVSNSSLQVKYYWGYVGRPGNTEIINSQTSGYSLSGTNDRTLTITGISLTLSGVYTCSAYLSGHLSTLRSSSQTVQQYSQINLEFSIISATSSSGSQLGVETGGSLEVHCIGTGFSIQLLTWEIDGNPIQHSPPSIQIAEISTTNPDLTDGYATETGQVTVSISIHNVQNPINSLTCVGNNELGRRENSLSVDLLGPPCTPEGVNIRELGETWAVLEWMNGETCFQGVQTVIRFTLNLTELNGQEVAIFTSSVSTPLPSHRYNLSGLATDSFYKVQVSGENTFGTSEYSIPITLHTLAPADTNVIMFPFGIIPGDSLVPNGKYAQSPAVSFEQNVPFGNRLSSLVYLSPLGVLSFDKPFHYWDVQPLGAGSSLQELSILAPFWSDVDYTSQGSLFYQLYSDTQANSQILHNATQLAVESANAPVSFIARSLLVATWSRVLPSSGQTQAFEENSFQLGLVTDHTTSYALFGYKRGDMSWSTVLNNDPLIGFSAASTLLQTHPLSRTPNAHEIDLTSGKPVTVIGYNISYSLQEIQTADQQCSVWQQSASQLQLDTPACPCTLPQAAADERFSFDNTSPQISYVACYVSLFEYTGPSQRCCYSERLKTLISDGIFRGSSLLINPTARSDLHLSGDYRAYENCCLLSDSCEKYFSNRVSNNCSQYTPTGFVWGFGLAHIITADSNEYRINGLGEFWLLSTGAPCPIQVQARTELVQGFEITSFTAITLSESICGSNVFISLSADKTKLVLYHNSTEVTLGSQELVTNCLLLTYLSDVEGYSLKFSFGASLRVRAINTVLNFKMTFPREICYNRTQGIIGQWDGDASNDLLMRNGTLLSENVTDREKEVFAESWRLTEEESFMVYETGNYSTYNPNHFEPSTFIDEILSAGVSPEIVRQCSEKRACLFDQLLTGQEGLANTSRDIYIISVETEIETNTYPPYLSGAPVLFVSTREEFSYTLTAVKMLYVSSPIRDSILSFSDDVYRLTGYITEDIGEFRISFYAIDLTTELFSRELSPTILFCTCPLSAQCSLSPQQTVVQGEFYNLSCGCEKGINITEGHTCITSPDCLIQLDLYFVIDGTSALDSTRFSQELDLVLDLIEQFNYPAAGTFANRVGFLVYTGDVVNYTNLSIDFSTIITQLEATTFPDGNTNLNSPLEFLLSHIFTEESSTQSLVAYLTFGQQSSSVDIDVLASLSEKLERERGVRIVVIGFGISLNETHLRAISTGEADDNYLAFNSIAEAQYNKSEISQELCHTVIPATTPTMQTTDTTYQSTTHTSPTTSPTPTSNQVLVTLKFTLSYPTFYSLIKGDLDGFLSAIVRALGNKAPIGTLLSVDGYIEVSFEIDRNVVNPLHIRSMLYQSELRQLFPYLSDVVLTEYSSIDSIYLGLESNVFSFIAAAVSVSLVILLICTHTHLKILFGVQKIKSKNIEIENESEFEDAVASLVTEKRTRITRPGSSMPRESFSIDVNAERPVSVKSESVSYYGKSSVSEIPLFKPRARIMSRALSPEQISDMLRESPPYTIHLEFDALPSNLVSVDEMPPGTEAKNRFPNILPPPHSRVPLFLKYNVPTSDYINASFIRGYNMMSRAYIATQAPMYNTIDEFWRMIWEQRCEVVLMLTELVERGVHKCTHYWPDGDVSAKVIFGELEVTACDKDYKSCYILSRFKIKLRTDKENKEVREVNHFWFKQWPDYGIPETGIPIITLLLDSRAYAKNSQSPVVMHCSSGIGRTGVFVAVDVGMHELEKKGRADLLKIVSLIRQDRGGMVQTKDQYLLIYKTLLAYSDFLKKAQQPD